MSSGIFSVVLSLFLIIQKTGTKVSIEEHEGISPAGIDVDYTNLRIIQGSRILREGIGIDAGIICGSTEYAGKQHEQ